MGVVSPLKREHLSPSLSNDSREKSVLKSSKIDQMLNPNTFIMEEA